jgi:serine/threonine protein kinase
VQGLRSFCCQVLSIVDIEDPHEDDFNELYIITPLYDKDLDKILHSGMTVTDEQTRYIVYQLLCALKYVHSASILHRDLKPANCLIQENCDIAICDFGLARYVDPDEAKGQAMTEYVITRWYRPPELVLAHNYDSSVDIWALGCVLAQRM